MCLSEEPPPGKSHRFQKISDAVFALNQRKIELFIHDGPAVAWMISENEPLFKLIGNC